MSKMSRRQRTVVHTYTPAVRAKPATRGGVTRGGKLVPATPAQPGSPATGITNTSEEYQSSNAPSISGNPQFIMVLLLILFAIVTWNDLTSNLLSIIWDPSAKNNITTLNWGKYVGMMIFIVVAVFISLISEEVAGVVLMLTVGILIVYLVENNGGNITGLLNWARNLGTSSKTKPTSPKQ